MINNNLCRGKKGSFKDFGAIDGQSATCLATAPRDGSLFKRANDLVNVISLLGGRPGNWGKKNEDEMQLNNRKSSFLIDNCVCSI